MNSGGIGPVDSRDIFPKKDIYQEPEIAEKKALPVQIISDILNLQESDIGLIIIQKRETGGYLVVTQTLLKPQSDMRQRLNLALGRLQKMFLEALRKQK